MFASDVDNVPDLIAETLNAFKNPPAAATQRAGAAELSAGLLSENFEPDQILKNIENSLKREFFRNQLAEALKSAENGQPLTEEQVTAITASALQHTSVEERAKLLNSLILEEVTPTQTKAIANLLNHDHFGFGLRGTEAVSFFSELTKGSLETLRELILIAPTEKHAESIFNSWLDNELNEIIDSLPGDEIKLRFLDESLSTREKLEVLEYLSSEERLAFVRDLLTFQENDNHFQNFLVDKLDNTLTHVNPDERAQLLLEILDSGKAIAAEPILRSSNSIAELVDTVEAVGVNELLALENKEVNELVAHALITPAIQSVDFSTPSQLSTEAEISEAYQNYLQQLQEVLRIVQTSPEVQETDIAKQYYITVMNNVLELQAETEIALESDDLMRDLVKRHYAMAALEFRYGVDISSIDSVTPILQQLAEQQGNAEEALDMHHLGINDITASPIDLNDLLGQLFGAEPRVPHWQLKHIEQIERVLEALPEAELHFTPLLYRIELVENAGFGVLGRRFGFGVIQIADFCLDNESISDEYNGEDALAIVLAHEIGHGVQLGNGGSGFTFPKGAEPIFSNGEEIHDFDEWVKISDWTVYSRDRYEKSEKDGHIILDGEELPLGRPVTFEDGKIVLSYDARNDVLFSHDPESQFSNHPYSRTNPWEDFAEAFSEYILLPERLIQDAPEKFLHLDLEYRRYAHDEVLQEQLAERLKDVREY